jgi:superfamily I DNA/RNA helicase/CRISPR/Cas system-associated exonuclease Cas4 (RecB family)
MPARYIPELFEVIAAAKEELLDSATCIELLTQHIAAESSVVTSDNRAQYQEVVHVYSKYGEILQRNGLVDYGDLVLLPVQLLRNAPSVLRQLLTQYPHILVDEFQDINRANGELVKLLAGTDGLGLWVVGDIRQSIYRWRGATPVYLRNFQGMFPTAIPHFLDTNYRSSATLTNFISQFAGAMNLPAPPRPWQAHRSSALTNPISVAVADDKQAELFGISETIQQHVDNGRQYKDIAILCRTNEQTAEIATFLTKAGIPVLHLGNFLLRPEIKDLLAVLSLVVDGQSVTWPRIGALLQEPLSIDVAMKLWHETDMKSAPFPVAATTALTSLSQLQQEELKTLIEVLRRHIGREDANTWWVLCEFLFEHGSYLRRLRAGGRSEHLQALLAIAQLLNLANAHSRRKIVGQDQAMIPAFLNYIRHMTRRNQREVDLPIAEIELNAVRILTVHKAKGLEFPVIFVPNLAKGRFPARLRNEKPLVPSVLSLRRDEPLDEQLLEEESCLFVAVTRAQDHLVLSRATSYHRQRGKPVTYEKSVLWRLLDPAVSAVNNTVSHIAWTFPASNRKTLVDVAPEDMRYDQLDLSAIRVYQRCPRQFYYRYVLGLSVREERGIYLHFHTIVSHVVDWLIAQATHDQFPDWSQVQTYLETELRENLPQHHAHSDWYRRLAVMQLQNLWEHIRKNRQNLMNWQTQVDSQFQIGSISIQFVIDEVFENEEQCSATIFRTGKPRKSHQTHPLPILSKQALQAQTCKPVRVYQHYLSTNEVIEVPVSANITVLRELDETVANIQRGLFPPSPERDRPERVCSNCRYLFLCEGHGTDT